VAASSLRRVLTKYTVTVDGDVFEIEVGSDGQTWVNNVPYEVDLRHVGGDGEYSLLLDNQSYEVHVAGSESGEPRVVVGGRPYRARLRRGHRFTGGCTSQGPPDFPGWREARPAPSMVEIRAPLPGLLVEMRVREGEYVQGQDVVAVLESMKMNLELRAPRSGVVRQLVVASGRRIAQDDVLVILDPSQA
jgi:biotin carboxyl carrier protein